jgi:hypothetical protein
LDFFDEESKSIGYTIIGGDPHYKNVTSVIKCVARGKSSTEVTWTCTYEPVGDAPAPQHMKEGVVKVLKTLEQAVKSRQTLSHTETIDASPDAVWKAVHNLDNIVPKYLPDVFESATNISGQYYGKPGGIRIVKFGPGMENGKLSLILRIPFFHQTSKVPCPCVVFQTKNIYFAKILHDPFECFA